MEKPSLPIRVPLTRPFDHDGTTYDHLLIDEPDLDAQIAYQELMEGIEVFPSPEGAEADPIASPRDAMRVTRFWISRCAGVPEAVAGMLKTADQAAVSAALDQIFGVVGEDQGNEEAA